VSNHWKLVHGVQHRTNSKRRECPFYCGTGWNYQSLSRNDVLRCRACSPAIESTRGADKSLTRPTSQFILFDGENISFDAGLVTYINSTNIPPIVIINKIYENQNLLSL
jgi:hypothetical protein